MKPGEQPSIFTPYINATEWYGNGTVPPFDCTGPNPPPMCFHPDMLVYDVPPFKLTVGKILSVIGMAILIVVSLGGNILVCTAFFYYRRLRTVTNYFVVSLAVSDLMVGSISMPLWLSYECTEWRTLPFWIDYEALAKFLELFDILSAVSSITNLTAISIDRFFSIMSPLHHRTRMTPRAAIIMLTLAWAYALGISLCRLIPGFKNYVAFSASAGFFIPLLVILGSYAGIYAKVSSKRSSMSRSIEKEWNIATTLFIVIFVFVICWLPFFLVSLLYKYCRSCSFEPKVLMHVVSLVKWMHYLNSGCNPFIYGFFNVNFKQAFKALFKKCCGRSGSESDFSLPYDEESVSFIRRPISNIKRRLERRRLRSRYSSKAASDFEHSYTTLTGNFYYDPQKMGGKNLEDKRRTFSMRSTGRNNSFRTKFDSSNGHTKELKNGYFRSYGFAGDKSVVSNNHNTNVHDINHMDYAGPLKDLNGQGPRSTRNVSTSRNVTSRGRSVSLRHERDLDDQNNTQIIDVNHEVAVSLKPTDLPPSYDEAVDKSSNSTVNGTDVINNELLKSARESCV